MSFPLDSKEEFDAETRRRALDSITTKFSNELDSRSDIIKDAMQIIGRQIEAFKKTETECNTWFALVTGDAQPAEAETARLLQSAVESFDFASEEFDLSLSIVKKRDGHDGPTATSSQPSLKEATPAPVIDVARTPSIDNDIPSLIASHRRKARTMASPSKLMIDSPSLGDDSPSKPSHYQESKRTLSELEHDIAHPLPKKAKSNPVTKGKEEILAIIRRREPFQIHNIQGSAFAFEYPAGTGQICIIWCSDCNFYGKVNPLNRGTTIQKHWAWGGFHKKEQAQGKDCLTMDDILADCTYPVQGGTLEWAEKNNELLKLNLKRSKAEAKASTAASPVRRASGSKSVHAPSTPSRTCAVRTSYPCHGSGSVQGGTGGDSEEDDQDREDKPSNVKSKRSESPY